MSGCNEKFKNMLHAYELGLLDENEIRKFEVHLMECDDCFAALKDFKEEAGLIRSDSGFAEFTKVKISEPKPKKETSYLKFILSAAAILVILLLKPWNFDFNSTKELVASENKLLILPFDNLADVNDSTTAKIIHNLMITDLNESKYLRVTPSAYTLAAIEENNISELDVKAIKTLGAFTKSVLVVKGNIVQLAPNFIISAEVYEPATGDLVGSVHQISNEGESIFAAVDSLTIKIKENLSLDIDFTNDNDLAVACLTTASSQAYHSYLLGVESFHKYYIRDAISHFEKVLEYDSAFAMAHYYLSRTKNENYIDSAYRFIDHSGTRERHYIQSRYYIVYDSLEQGLNELRWITENYPDETDAYYMLGRYDYYQANFESAVESFKKALTIDSKYKPAYNLLTYCYNMLDDYDNAIITINKYIELYPDEANPYDTRGDLYSFFGELEKAKESYRIALDIRPDFYSSLMYLGYMYLYQNNYKLADSCITALANSRSAQMRSAAKLYQPYLAIRQGNFELALKEIDRAIDENKKLGEERQGLSYNLQHRAVVLTAIGRQDEAVELMKQTLNDYRLATPNDSISFVSYYATLLFEVDNIDEIELLRDQIHSYREKNNIGRFSYSYLEGLVALHNKEYDSAEIYFIKSVEKLIEKNAYGYFLGHTLLARSYREAGKIAEAIEVLEKLNKIYTSRRLFFSPIDIHNYYLLGRLYEDSNWKQKAAEQYQLVLTHWGSNDAGIEFVEDARQRLEQLRNL